MLKAFKYEFFPNKNQKILLAKTFGCVRFLYNWGLNKKSKAWEEKEENISIFDLIKEVTQLKKTDEFSWLKEVPSQALQMALRNLDSAYIKFFKQQSKFPKFKKKSNKQSYQYPQGVKVKPNENKLFLPKIGIVKFANSRDLYGKIKTTSISQEPNGRYFVSILCDTGLKEPNQKKIDSKTAVGIDLGIKVFGSTSDEEVFENQKHLMKSLRKLRTAQRTLSRRYRKGKKNGEQSKNWHKQRKKVANLHFKVKCQRNDYLHKLSTYLVRKYDTICLEDLKVNNMMRNRKLSKHIGDVGWRMFSEMLAYKCKWYGKNLVVLNMWTPTSKRCSNCGNIKKQLKLSQRVYRCNECHISLDRDFNAAINIKKIGLKVRAK